MCMVQWWSTVHGAVLVIHFVHGTVLVIHCAWYSFGDPFCAWYSFGDPLCAWYSSSDHSVHGTVLVIHSVHGTVLIIYSVYGKVVVIHTVYVSMDSPACPCLWMCELATRGVVLNVKHVCQPCTPPVGRKPLSVCIQSLFNLILWWKQICFYLPLICTFHLQNSINKHLELFGNCFAFAVSTGWQVVTLCEHNNFLKIACIIL